jgi:hypothetical protein
MDADLLFGNEVDLKLQFRSSAPQKNDWRGRKLPILSNRNQLRCQLCASPFNDRPHKNFDPMRNT